MRLDSVSASRSAYHVISPAVAVAFSAKLNCFPLAVAIWERAYRTTSIVPNSILGVGSSATLTASFMTACRDSTSKGSCYSTFISR